MSEPNQVEQGPKLPLQSRVEELRAEVGQISAEILAERTGAVFNAQEPKKGEFQLFLFESSAVVSYPDMVAYSKSKRELPLHMQGILAYYFHTSDGSTLSGDWISFAELPDGRVYNQAFQGYTGDKLVKTFGFDLEAFKSTCERGGGVAAPYGDAAFFFQALPRLPLLVNYWCGDEDFTSTCKILFDKTVSHYLPTEVCAILGSILTGKLIKFATE